MEDYKITSDFSRRATVIHSPPPTTVIGGVRYVVKDGNVYDSSGLGIGPCLFIGTLRPDGGVEFCAAERAANAARRADMSSFHMPACMSSGPMICAPPGGYYTPPSATPCSALSGIQRLALGLPAAASPSSGQPARSTSPISTYGTPEWHSAMNSRPPPLLPEDRAVIHQKEKHSSHERACKLRDAVITRFSLSPSEAEAILFYCRTDTTHPSFSHAVRDNFRKDTLLALQAIARIAREFCISEAGVGEVISEMN